MAFLSSISTYLSKRKSEPSIIPNDRDIKRVRHRINSESITQVNTDNGENVILDHTMEDTQSDLSSKAVSSRPKYQDSMNKLIMSYVQSSSSLTVVDTIPRANLIRSLYSTKLIENINEDKNCSEQERLLWNMTPILFEDMNSTNTIDNHQIEKSNLIKPRQANSDLKKWIHNTVLEETKLIYQQEFGLNDENVDDIIIEKKIKENNPWKLAMHYMSTGQHIKTCELLLELGDNALSTLISLHHQGYDIRESVTEQIKLWLDKDLLNTLPMYQQKMWFILQGDLGYVNQLKLVTVQDLTWSQVLVLYINYFDRYGNVFAGLIQYHFITHNHSVVGIHQLKTKHYTATPSLESSYWYYLLIWWSSSSASSSYTSFHALLHNDCVDRKQIELYLPLRFRWLLSLHAPSLFHHETNELELWKDQWCDFLYQDKWEYLAIYASLYILNPHNTIYRLLSLREWEKEFYLIQQLKIPKQWIMDAKVTFAFNNRMYTKEIHYYLESGENDKAYDAIMNHLLPVSFLKDDQIDTVKLYLNRLSELYPNNNQIQQTVNNILEIQKIIYTFPNLLKETTLQSDQLEEMKNELIAAFKSLENLKKVFALSIKPGFCSKIAGQLLIIASLFRNHELFNNLLETCPVEFHCDNDMAKIISKSMVYSFNT
ncbi:hypothetical protein BJ944DRAFT_9392 [Cunninghamella echinulata]|nr:hypothetical protein BJ944DRAFT_9392 [Cunninghamella echinulata]